jgi:hypothetical protein
LEHTFGARTGEVVKAGTTDQTAQGDAAIGFVEDLMMAEAKLKAFWQPG